MFATKPWANLLVKLETEDKRCKKMPDFGRYQKIEIS
jgi:hypothetical protein